MEVQLKSTVQNTGIYRRQLELPAVSTTAQHRSPTTFILRFHFRQEKFGVHSKNIISPFILFKLRIAKLRKFVSVVRCVRT
jgi:hypothetical protein